jgi:carboxymethylenebutenolidase
VRVPLIVVVHFRDGKLAHEHIYWDQASLLAQIGKLDTSRLPIVGIEQSRRLQDISTKKRK